MNDAGDMVSVVAAVATVLTAVATCGIAFATLRYARGTMDLASATLRGVNAQADASTSLARQNRTIADAAIRAQVVSSTRLAWMDSVRDNVAELLSIDQHVGEDERGCGSPRTEFVENLSQRRLMIRHRIEFRLDPDKPTHAELLTAIDDLLGRRAAPIELRERIRALTVSIMEGEWRRVRREVGAPVSADRDIATSVEARHPLEDGSDSGRGPTRRSDAG